MIMPIDYQETSKDLKTRIDIHQKYGGRDIDAWMLDTLKPEANISILDVGCGSGKQCKAFYNYLDGKADITGVDVSKELLADAQVLNQSLGTPFNIEEMDFNKPFPFPDETFDLLTCCFAIYYAADIPFTIREMHRVLKPGGRLFTTGPMPENKQLFYDVIKQATGKPILRCRVVHVTPARSWTRSRANLSPRIWRSSKIRSRLMRSSPSSAILELRFPKTANYGRASSRVRTISNTS
jgi:ubiquinone/menaquinone biosynthesis C-methylase UbiE